MTTELIQKYSALIHSMRHYISQEYPNNGSWVTSDRQTYAYFIQQAAKNKKAPRKTQTSVPTKNTPIATPLARPTMQTPAAPREINRSSIPHSSPENNSKIIHQSTMAPKSSDPLPKTSTIEPQIDSAQKAKTSSNQKHFIRESIPSAPEVDFSQLHAFIKEKFPSIRLIDQIADDSGAKAIAQSWKAPGAEVLILSFSELPKEKAFLGNLAIAISQTLASAKVISAAKYEQEKGWDRLFKSDHLRLIIANNYSLHNFPELMKYYHEHSTGKHTLGPLELHLLPDLSLYMQQPSLKATLWKALRSQLLR